MRNINSGDPWQILFYRSLSFIFCMSIFLIQQNKKATYNKIKNIDPKIEYKIEYGIIYKVN